MAAIFFFIEVLEWHWHYDPVLDYPYLTATSQVCLYIFFQRAFAAPLLGPLFDPVAPFPRVPLYMAHPDLIQPHKAQPPIAPPPSVQPESLEKMMNSSSSSSLAPDDSFGLADHGPTGLLPNGFLP